MGLKEIGSDVCEAREMIITVYAKQDWVDKTVNLQIGAFGFETIGNKGI